jgi:ribosomal protein L22
MPQPRKKEPRAKAPKPDGGGREAEQPSVDVKAEDPKPSPRAKTKAKGDSAPAKKAAPKKAAPKKPAAKKPPAKKAAAKPKAEPEKVVTGAPLVRASAKYVRGSARKARLVADHIRGKDVVEARKVLSFSPRHAARDLEKLLNSAVANAEHNLELVGDDLRVKEIRVDEGPTLKRWRPRAQGRATRINKRTAHLSIALTPKE